MIKQEELVSEAFSIQAAEFDTLDNENPILQWMRNIVRQYVLSSLKGNSTILELNAGTGLDAVYFSLRGHHVLATDNAMGMIQEINKKIKAYSLEENLQVRQCSFNDLSQIMPQRFDCIYSNFGGLNCAEDLHNVIQQFDDLLNPNGIVTLVIMPPICPWELLSLFKGNFKMAFRRMKGLDYKSRPANRNPRPAKSHLEGIYFDTYYYSPSFVKKAFGAKYKMIHLQGLASISLPPYKEKFAINNPKLYKTLAAIDQKISRMPPFCYWADHYVISFLKK